MGFKGKKISTSSPSGRFPRFHTAAKLSRKNPTKQRGEDRRAMSETAMIPRGIRNGGSVLSRPPPVMRPRACTRSRPTPEYTRSYLKSPLYPLSRSESAEGRLKYFFLACFEDPPTKLHSRQREREKEEWEGERARERDGR